jgi:hypothetical protein
MHRTSRRRAPTATQYSIFEAPSVASSQCLPHIAQMITGPIGTRPCQAFRVPGTLERQQPCGGATETPRLSPEQPRTRDFRFDRRLTPSSSPFRVGSAWRCRLRGQGPGSYMRTSVRATAQGSAVTRLSRAIANPNTSAAQIRAIARELPAVGLVGGRTRAIRPRTGLISVTRRQVGRATRARAPPRPR